MKKFMPSILFALFSPAMTAPCLSTSDYERLSGQALARIEATLDQWLQDDVIDIDAQRTGGLLEMSLPNGSKLIVNTQPPLQELCLAARGGGFHFRHVDGAWRDTRDGAEFFSRLSEAASLQSGQPLTF